jgi:hypothetical protein
MFSAWDIRFGSIVCFDRDAGVAFCQTKIIQIKDPSAVLCSCEHVAANNSIATDAAAVTQNAAA